MVGEMEMLRSSKKCRDLVLTFLMSDLVSDKPLELTCLSSKGSAVYIHAQGRDLS